MKVMLLAVAVASIATATFGQESNATLVKPYQAGQYQGSLVKVRGTAHVEDDLQIPGIDVNLTGPDGHVQFTGFIPKLNAYAFSNVHALNGRQVEMYGIVELFRGHPATQLTNTDQLQAWSRG